MKWKFQLNSASNTYFLVGIFPDLSTMSSSLVCAFWRNVTAGELSCARENASFISVSVHSYNSALKWQTRGLPHSTVYYTVPYGALPTLPYPNILTHLNSFNLNQIITVKSILLYHFNTIAWGYILEINIQNMSFYVLFVFRTIIERCN